MSVSFIAWWPKHGVDKCLTALKYSKPKLLHQYVITDKTWIHHFTSELKRSSSERKETVKPQGHVSFIPCWLICYDLWWMTFSERHVLKNTLFVPFSMHINKNCIYIFMGLSSLTQSDFWISFDLVDSSIILKQSDNPAAKTVADLLTTWLTSV